MNAGESPRRLPRRWRRLLRLLRSAAVGAGVGWVVFSYVAQVFRIEGESMSPSLRPGERVVVDKLGFRLGTIERGDVLVFRLPGDEQATMVKRVVGLPGETVQFEGNEITVMPSAPMGPEARSVFVEDGHFFVAGDNRPRSSDSRRFGLLAEDAVIGRAVFRVAPPGRIRPAPQ